MIPRTLSIPVAASLGKRKVRDLDNDCLPAKMSITMAGHVDCEYLNIWIENDEKQRFGMQIGNTQLKKLLIFLTSEG